MKYVTNTHAHTQSHILTAGTYTLYICFKDLRNWTEQIRRPFQNESKVLWRHQFCLKPWVIQIAATQLGSPNEQKPENPRMIPDKCRKCLSILSKKKLYTIIYDNKPILIFAFIIVYNTRIYSCVCVFLNKIPRTFFNFARMVFRHVNKN